MQQYNEAEVCFLEEVREKKKAANGVHSKTGKRGYVGKMLFPSDIMSRKDKIKHRRASKITMSNLFDTILSLDEFKNLETHEQRNRLQYLRQKYTIKEIQQGMGISNKTYYDIIEELGLPKDRRNSKPRKPRTASTSVKNTTPDELALELPTIAIQAIQEPTPEPVQEIIVNGLHLRFNGTYSPDMIQKQLLKFATILDEESDDFYCELTLIQKPKS